MPINTSGIALKVVVILVVIATGYTGYMAVSGPGTFHVPITNQTYPEYTGSSVVLAPAHTVIFNASGPGPGAQFITFSVNRTGTLMGSWESSNVTALTIVPYTLSKTTIQSYLASIQNNSSVYATQGSFNLQLQPGEYYLIIGPVINSIVRVMATNEIQVVYS